MSGLPLSPALNRRHTAQRAEDLGRLAAPGPRRPTRPPRRPAPARATGRFLIRLGARLAGEPAPGVMVSRP